MSGCESVKLVLAATCPQLEHPAVGCRGLLEQEVEVDKTISYSALFLCFLGIDKYL